MDTQAANQTDTTDQTPIARLWTPWRMRYVGGGAAETGCLFCNRLASDDDVRSLLLYRGDHAFIMMNLFPYNTGHVMFVPNEHVATPETSEEATLGSLGAFLRPTLRALRRVLNADGFNIGMNVGAVAGAGVADHLHQHIVPRWQGDANFMPILAATMVLPELIPVTYAKIRAELGREIAGLADQPVAIKCVVLTEDLSTVLILDSNRGPSLPTATADPGQALWRAASRSLTNLGVEAVLAGWAGPARVSALEAPALTFLASSPLPSCGSLRAETIDRALSLLEQDPDRQTVGHAIASLADTSG